MSSGVLSKKSPDLDKLVHGYKDRMSLLSKHQNQKEALELLQHVLDLISYQHTSDILRHDPSKMEQLLAYTGEPDESLPIDMRDLADLLIKESIELPTEERERAMKQLKQERKEAQKQRQKAIPKPKPKPKIKPKITPKKQLKQQKPKEAAKQEYVNDLYNYDYYQDANQVYDALLSNDYSTQNDVFQSNMNHYNHQQHDSLDLDISILIITTIGLLCLFIGFVSACIIYKFVNKTNKTKQYTSNDSDSDQYRI